MAVEALSQSKRQASLSREDPERLVRPGNNQIAIEPIESEMINSSEDNHDDNRPAETEIDLDLIL